MDQWFKHPAWRPAFWLLSAANVAAVWVVVASGESLHATLHAFLGVVFALSAMSLTRRPARDVDATERGRDFERTPAEPQRLQDVESRLAELEERLDFTERALVEARRRIQQPPKE